MYMKNGGIYVEKYFGWSKEKFNQLVAYWNFMYPKYHIDPAK